MKSVARVPEFSHEHVAISSFYSAPIMKEYCEEQLCLFVLLCVCVPVREYLRNNTSYFYQFLHATNGRKFLLLWWRCDTLRTSGLWVLT